MSPNYFSLCLFVVLSCTSIADEDSWKKKDVRDYTDADLERLFEQWEDADEPLEEDELPEWKKSKPKIDMSKLNPNDPEGMMKLSKSGQTLMMFVTISGNPTESETTEISQLWQGSLFNAHYDMQRYVVGSDRVLFVLKDGSKAWEIKEYLVQQERCYLVTIEGKDYYGKAHPEGAGSSAYPQKQEKKDGKKRKKQKKKNSSDNQQDVREKIEL